MFKGREDYEVVIEFDAWATDLARGRAWHASQEFVVLAGGCSRLRLRLNNIADIEPWVLSWGIHATVIRPKELAKRVEQNADELKQRYQRLGRGG